MILADWNLLFSSVTNWTLKCKLLCMSRWNRKPFQENNEIVVTDGILRNGLIEIYGIGFGRKTRDTHIPKWSTLYLHYGGHKHSILVSPNTDHLSSCETFLMPPFFIIHFFNIISSFLTYLSLYVLCSIDRVKKLVLYL